MPKGWNGQAHQTGRFSQFCMSDETEKVYQKLEDAINT